MPLEFFIVFNFKVLRQQLAELNMSPVFVSYVFLLTDGPDGDMMGPDGRGLEREERGFGALGNPTVFGFIQILFGKGEGKTNKARTCDAHNKNSACQ